MVVARVSDMCEQLSDAYDRRHGQFCSGWGATNLGPFVPNILTQ